LQFVDTACAFVEQPIGVRRFRPSWAFAQNCR
jgi:hypothetical protein